MTSTIARNGPDLIGADPPLRQPSTSRWVVMLWADPLRARFRLWQTEPDGTPVVAVEADASLVGSEWSPQLPLTIPTALAAKAVRQLLQLQVIAEATREPAPPAGPPLVASQADAERLAAQLQENAKELIAVGYANESRELLELGIQVAGAATYLVSEKSIRFDESPTQRGNGHGGPTTPKPLIKPQSTGPRMVGDSIKPPPIKPQFPPPRKIREDFL